MISQTLSIRCLLMACFMSVFSSAFVVIPTRTMCVHHKPTTNSADNNMRLCQTQRLSEIDEMCIENVAEYCLKAENALSGNTDCDVDEYEALVNQLRDQRRILAQHLDYVDSLLVKLQAGPSTTSSTDAVQETYFAG